MTKLKFLRAILSWEECHFYLKRLILFFIANVGNTFSSASVIQYLKNEKRSLSSETLYNYIRYCQEACLLHLVPREDLIGKRLLSFQEKIYLTDHGIREALYGNNQRDINQILENIVYMELLRNGIRHMNIRQFLLCIE